LQCSHEFQLKEKMIMTEQGMALMCLMTLLMLLVYMWAGIFVGRARGKFNVKAPATQGPEEFNRVYRAHMNTLEQLAVALPAFWVFNLFQAARWAALLMAIWCVGRVLYVLSYARAAEKRELGFMISFIPTVAAILGSLFYAGRILIQQ
jgi:glutathione S-transferase